MNLNNLKSKFEEFKSPTVEKPKAEKVYSATPHGKLGKREIAAPVKLLSKEEIETAIARAHFATGAANLAALLERWNAENATVIANYENAVLAVGDIPEALRSNTGNLLSEAEAANKLKQLKSDLAGKKRQIQILQAEIATDTQTIARPPKTSQEVNIRAKIAHLLPEKQMSLIELASAYREQHANVAAVATAINHVYSSENIELVANLAATKRIADGVLKVSRQLENAIVTCNQETEIDDDLSFLGDEIATIATTTTTTPPPATTAPPAETTPATIPAVKITQAAEKLLTKAGITAEQLLEFCNENNLVVTGLIVENTKALISQYQLAQLAV